MNSSFLILPLLLFGAAGRTRETGPAKPKAGPATGPACRPPPEPRPKTAATPEDPTKPAPYSADRQVGMDPAGVVGESLQNPGDGQAASDRTESPLVGRKPG